jgi:hypothetical protein
MHPRRTLSRRRDSKRRARSKWLWVLFILGLAIAAGGSLALYLFASGLIAD